MTTSKLAARISLLSSVVFTFGFLVFTLLTYPGSWYASLLAFIVALVFSLPVLIAMLIFLPVIKRIWDSYNNKIYILILLCAICAFMYGIAAFLFESMGTLMEHHWSVQTFQFALGTFAVLFTTSLITLFLSRKQLEDYFEYSKPVLINNKQTKMDTQNNEELPYQTQTSRSNRILIKGAITAALIGIMMIPTIFIRDLVRERQSRNEDVVKEVDSRWAMAQTLTGPYIFLPYKTTFTDAAGKPQISHNHLLIIPENKNVSGNIIPLIRERSIYRVLLYHAVVTDQGNFVFNLPKEITADQVEWNDAQICFGISDFKGIEEKIVIRFNGKDNELAPGLPVGEKDEKGLSAPIALTAANIGKPLNYQMNIKIRGSEMLHFVPLGGNSRYALSSNWRNPSFDGSNLPSNHTISKTGFSADWNFNKANLPFGTVMNDFKFDPASLAFGVTMIEPADQYAKTNRSIKYAILIIGLTFSLFFIIELMQRKPIHPVQYVLIGLALVIFYSLLLAISEFLEFDFAYLIAAVGTILLIGLYAKAHFRRWRSAGTFTGVLTLLYGFIFVLIRLEDTALLVGSIALFIILALTMYASKKVNWYGSTEIPAIQ